MSSRKHVVQVSSKKWPHFVRSLFGGRWTWTTHFQQLIVGCVFKRWKRVKRCFLALKFCLLRFHLLHGQWLSAVEIMVVTRAEKRDRPNNTSSSLFIYIYWETMLDFSSSIKVDERWLLSTVGYCGQMLSVFHIAFDNNRPVCLFQVIPYAFI